MKQFMEVAGRRMAYLDEGQGPVLLLAKLPVGQRHVAPQAEASRGEYRRIVPELWGHGDS